ncbi:MAG TPA: tryptophan synthase subunit alpha [Acidobacteriota bacterium]|jgi:tryptophan synthase alpha chain
MTSSPITEAFERCRAERRRAFIPFIAAGDPNLEVTAKALQALDQAGSDVIELGLPFSDPIADGPIIQASYQRALEGGVALQQTFELLESLKLRAPVLLFTYLNPVLQYGLERLAEKAKRMGVSGLLVSDLTPEEANRYMHPLRRNWIDTVFLAAPTTTPKRMEKILGCCTGFLYFIARTGVTGKQTNLDAGVTNQINLIRSRSKIPIAIGFGMRTPEDVQKASRIGDGVVVGSAIVEKLHALTQQPVWEEDFRKYIAAFVQATKN